jgi:uncharacterized protein YbjT (DUF2867 family)
MRVLLLGATGLIGSGVMARLLADAHDVLAVAHRPVHRSRLGGVTWVTVDLAKAGSPEIWRTYLTGIDAVVNCAGVLQDSPSEHTDAVHATGIAALFAACEALQLRVIHFSAIGVDRETPSAFSRSKRKGEEDLMGRALPWVILRPSVVLGRAAAGGSALVRGLAALPVLPKPPDAGPLNVVQLDDVVATVMFLLPREAPSRIALDLAGPARQSLTEVVAIYRAWFGWRSARVLSLPGPLWRLFYRLGDFAAVLGWRSPVRSNARRELVRGAMGDPAEWMRVTGIVPRKLDAALRGEPVSVQERWFARLYFLKPLVFAVFALFWLATGLISLGPGYAIGVSLMLEGGAGVLSGPSVIAGACADILVGSAIAWRPTTRRGLYAALALTAFYIVAGTLLLPRLWADPLGPMLKIWPIVAFNLVALAILEER